MKKVALTLLTLTLLVYGAVAFMYHQAKTRMIREMQEPHRVSSASAAVAGGRHHVGAPAVKKSSGKTSSDFQVIITRNIFQAQVRPGEKSREEEKREDKKALAKTSLKLILLGTISGSKEDARAIIVDGKEKRQDIYQIGDAVQGAFIKSIGRGRVVLEVNGRNEELLIKEPESGPPDRRPAARTSPPPPPPVTPVKKESPAPLVRPHRRVNLRPHNKLLRESRSNRGSSVEKEFEDGDLRSPEEELEVPENNAAEQE